MARLGFGGAETADDTLEVLNVAASTPIYDTVTVRSGTYSYKFDSTAGNVATFNQLTNTSILGRTYYFRQYYHYTNAPSSDTAILAVQSSGTVIYAVRLTTGALLQLWKHTNPGGVDSQIGSSSAALTASQWYRIELKFKVNSGSNDDDVELRLDGVTVASETGATVTTVAWTDILWGWVTAPGASKVCRSDDWALNDDQGSNQNSWPGDAKVVLLVGLSDKVRPALWTGGAGGTTNLWDAVNNKPPIGTATETDLTQIEHAGSAAGSVGNEYVTTLPTYASMGLSDGGGYGIPLPLGEDTNSVNLGTVAGNARQAMSFVARGSTISQIAVNLAKSGVPSDNLEVAIQADSAGSPSGTDLALATIAGTTLTTSLARYVLNFASSFALTNGTTYWVVFRRSGAVGADSYVINSSQLGDSSAFVYKQYDSSVPSWTAFAGTYIGFFLISGAQDTINAMFAFMAHGEDIATGTKLLALRPWFNPFGSTANVSAGGDVGALGTYPTNWAINRRNIIYNPDYDAANAPQLSVTRPETASRVASVCFMGVMVEYVPAPRSLVPFQQHKAAYTRRRYF